MMRRSASRLCLLPLVLAMCLEGCSVKEDRSICPCYVYLDFTSLSVNPPFHRAERVSCAARVFSSEELLTAEWLGQEYEFTVPRGRVDMAAVFGSSSFSRSCDTLRLVQGQEKASKLFVWAERTECHDDSYHAVVRPRKQYCELGIELDAMVPENASDYNLRVRTASSGLKLFPVTPAGDPAVLQAEWDEADGRFKVTVPRQWQDSPLLVELYQTGADSSLPVISLDVAPSLTAGGYDWSKTDLDDACVLIDSSYAQFSVEVMEWTLDKLILVEI